MGRPELGFPITGLPEDDEELAFDAGSIHPQLSDKQAEKQKHLLWMLDASIKEELALRRRTFIRRQWYRLLVWSGWKVKEESWSSVYEPYRLHLLHFFRKQVADVKYDWSHRHWEKMPKDGGSWASVDTNFDQRTLQLILNREPRKVENKE